jgi:hypothetical protein
MENWLAKNRVAPPKRPHPCAPHAPPMRPLDLRLLKVALGLNADVSANAD